MSLRDSFTFAKNHLIGTKMATKENKLRLCVKLRCAVAVSHIQFSGESILKFRINLKFSNILKYSINANLSESVFTANTSISFSTVQIVYFEFHSLQGTRVISVPLPRVFRYPSSISESIVSMTVLVIV